VAKVEELWKSQLVRRGQIVKTSDGVYAVLSTSQFGVRAAKLEPKRTIRADEVTEQLWTLVRGLGGKSRGNYV
jgi:hypothetical protein